MKPSEGVFVKCHGCAGAGTQQGFRCDLCRGFGAIMYNEVPNLDALTPGELRAFRDSWNGADHDKAAGLVGPRARAEVYVKRLVRYARLKARAMALRASGNILGAEGYEGRAEALYERLPHDLRW